MRIIIICLMFGFSSCTSDKYLDDYCARMKVEFSKDPTLLHFERKIAFQDFYIESVYLLDQVQFANVKAKINGMIRGGDSLNCEWRMDNCGLHFNNLDSSGSGLNRMEGFLTERSGVKILIVTETQF